METEEGDGIQTNFVEKLFDVEEWRKPTKRGVREFRRRFVADVVFDFGFVDDLRSEMCRISNLDFRKVLRKGEGSAIANCEG